MFTAITDQTRSQHRARPAGAWVQRNHVPNNHISTFQRNWEQAAMFLMLALQNHGWRMTRRPQTVPAFSFISTQNKSCWTISFSIHFQNDKYIQPKGTLTPPLQFVTMVTSITRSSAGVKPTLEWQCNSKTWSCELIWSHREGQKHAGLHLTSMKLWMSQAARSSSQLDVFMDEKHVEIPNTSF